MEYRHTQWGYTALPTLLLFIVIAVPIATAESSSWLTVAVGGFMLAILAIVLLFSRLEVAVAERSVSAAFGFGWPRKVIDLDDITAARQVRNQWWYGWGIRRVAKGWMYNVWGLDAVELDLAKGGVFRIGSDEPEQLLAALSLQLR